MKTSSVNGQVLMHSVKLLSIFAEKAQTNSTDRVLVSKDVF